MEGLFKGVSKKGQSGSDVTDLVEGSGLIYEAIPNVSGGVTNSKSRISFDDDNDLVVYFTTSNPGGGSDTLKIAKVLTNGSVQDLSSVNFNFGATYMWSNEFVNFAAVSPNKDFIVVRGDGILKIFVIPVTKSGETYTLGTPVEYNTFETGETFSNPVVIGNNEFSVGVRDTNTTKEIRVFKFENGSITLSKTIQTSIKPVWLKYLKNKYLVCEGGSSSNNIIIDNEGTSKASLTFSTSNAKFYIMKNRYVVILINSISNLIVVDMQEEELVEFDKTALSGKELVSYNLVVDLRQVIDSDSNKSIIINYCSNTKQPIALLFDFELKKISEITILNNRTAQELQYTTMYCLILENNFAIYVSNGGTSDGGKLKLFDAVISLKYKNNTYGLTALGDNS